MKVYIVIFNDCSYEIYNYALNKEGIKKIAINKVNEYCNEDKKHKIIEVSNIDFRKGYGCVKYEMYWGGDFGELHFNFRELTLI